VTTELGPDRGDSLPAVRQPVERLGRGIKDDMEKAALKVINLYQDAESSRKPRRKA
jgi:hypothetical protein